MPSRIQQFVLILYLFLKNLYAFPDRANVDEARDAFGTSVLKRKTSMSPMVFVTMLNEA